LRWVSSSASTTAPLGNTARAIIRNRQGTIWVRHQPLPVGRRDHLGNALGAAGRPGRWHGRGGTCWRRPWGGHRQGRPVRDRPDVPGLGPGHAQARHVQLGRAGDEQRRRRSRSPRPSAAVAGPCWSPRCPWMPSGGSRRPCWGQTSS
jgi:hypothetical protein